MSDSEDTKQCPNCKIDIISANFTIHFVHCERNIYLCSKCEQPVNYEKKTEHDNTDHVTVSCNSCQLVLEKYQLENHLINDCPDRKVTCKICDIDVKAVEIQEHEDYCGSRTEKCEECEEYVMLKYKTLHLESNHTFIKLSDEPGPSPSWQHGRRTLCNFMPDLSSASYKPPSVRKKRSSEFVRKSRNSASSESKKESDEMSRTTLDLLFQDCNNAFETRVRDNLKPINNKKSPKRDVDEWPTLSGLKSLSLSDEKDDRSTAFRANVFKQTELDENSDLMYALKVSHEINSDAWSKKFSTDNAEAVKNHYTPVSNSDSSVEKSITKDMFENKTQNVNEEFKAGNFKNDFNYSYDKNESVKLPCEFCGKLIVSNNLTLHQSRCILYMTENCNRRNPSYEMPYFDEDMDKKIPCGICNKFFRLSLLENHQFNCQRNFAKSSKTQTFSKNLNSVNIKSQPGLQNGLEPSSPQLTRVGTRSEWLTELSKSNEAKELSSNLNLLNPESGVIARPTKASRKNRRAPSPPTRR